MKITADTNVLVRALVQDDPGQARAASALLEQAELVAVPLPVLCELVWVLHRVSRPQPWLSPTRFNAHPAKPLRA